MAVSKGFGTKVAVNKDGILRVVPSGDKFELGPDEKELKRVAGLEISIMPDEAIRAKADVFLNMEELSATGRFVFRAFDPNDFFQEKRIAMIEFEDGSVWDWEG